ncbi:hypothetical protein PoB_000319500 [Plakobranchus ocellatus]|uniref:Uncharacterized protein n=1 Tax=Plakobranchus ocellatus TaxID=259542 RepID=A0AAV3Y1Z4_9GAST|nr:hypothetical protein PoB_000319500 [Plakobranchus ocellatus]
MVVVIVMMMMGKSISNRWFYISYDEYNDRDGRNGGDNGDGSVGGGNGERGDNDDANDTVCIEMGTWICAAHIAGKENQEADYLSRHVNIDAAWQLHSDIWSGTIYIQKTAGDQIQYSDDDESFVIPPSPTNNKVLNISSASIINGSACTPPALVNNAAPAVPVATVINDASCAPLAQVDNTAPDTPPVQVVNTDICAPSASVKNTALYVPVALANNAATNATLAPNNYADAPSPVAPTTNEVVMRGRRRKRNFHFGQPSLDTCKTCDKLEMDSRANPLDDNINRERELQLREAEAGQEIMKNDFDASKANNGQWTIAFDFQQTLPTPHINTSVTFYSRQL